MAGDEWRPECASREPGAGCGGGRRVTMRNFPEKISAPARWRVEVRGIVQGVGFRPFIYRLAREQRLSGWVQNTSGNVVIEVEGDEEALSRFLDSLPHRAPPMAHIENMAATPQPVRGEGGFFIRESRAEAEKYQPISPDVATCGECLREIFSPGDRRYLYPFTNCTDCGPRFTIIRDIPYDRPLTTMRDFIMCSDCREEYDDPLNRRFHAQPNACPRCGPALRLTDAAGADISGPDVIGRVVELLGEGNIVAVKGLGGFQLACDATSREAVEKLRGRKKRPGKPFALMMASLEEAEKHCRVSPEEAALLGSPQAPIVLLEWRRSASGIAPGVAEKNRYLGVMLPYTPLHHILMRRAPWPLVMTSGNLSEEPICRDNDEALRRLKGIADYFLVHNRDIHARYDDSVCLVERGAPRTVRRARGYAPSPIGLPFRARQVLACGAEEKSTFCLTRDEHAFLSQHIGDMDNEETLEHFKNTIDLYRKLFRVRPEAIAYDCHPEYLSGKYALEQAADQGLKAVPVQHHHAHIVSCLTENDFTGPVIGVAFDGTGYGDDGNLWGGEFLVGDGWGVRRAAHLEYVPMPGGAAAVRRPYRMALGYLYTSLDPEFSPEGLPLAGRVAGEELSVIRKQLERGLNAPLTSSAGRLFDAVAALAGVRMEIEYAAQAAIELEMLVSEDLSRLEAYPFRIGRENGVLVIRLPEFVSAVVDDVRKGVPAPVISGRFHLTVARIIGDTCRRVAERSGLETVALSGGVFQNRRLFNLAADILERDGFRVLSHRRVPCNDGGIALGQAVIAHHVLEKS